MIKIGNIGVETSEKFIQEMQKLHEKCVIELFNHLSDKYGMELDTCSDEDILAMYEEIKLFVDTERGGY